MVTYSLMNLPFLAIILLLDVVWLKTRVVAERRTWLIMAVMLLLTASFHQFLTGLPIYIYNDAKISGIHLGYIPVEDFSYTIAAVIGIGAIVKKWPTHTPRA